MNGRDLPMDVDDIRQFSAELLSMLIQASASLTTIQGIEVGFFDWIPLNKAITAGELSRQMGYDISRVERWLRFALAVGLCLVRGRRRRDPTGDERQ